MEQDGQRHTSISICFQVSYKLFEKKINIFSVTQEELEKSFIWLLEKALICPTIDTWHFGLWREDWHLCYPDAIYDGQPNENLLHSEISIAKLGNKEIRVSFFL